MRRAMVPAVVTAVVTAGVVLAGTVPAAAAPVEESATSSFLVFESTGQCTRTGRCTDVFLEAFTGTQQPAQVCVSVSSYRRTSGGGRTAIADEAGCADAAASLRLTRGLGATLQPTTLVLEAFSCEGDGEQSEGQCSVTSRRDVTVAATGSPNGPVTVSRDRGRSTTGRCRLSYRSTTTSAPVAGSLTVDGTTYAGAGQAGTSSYRSSSRACPTG